MPLFTVTIEVLVDTDTEDQAVSDTWALVAYGTENDEISAIQIAAVQPGDTRS